MKVLVTGAFGWTAVCIVQALNKAKYHIIGFDLPSAICPAEVESLFDG
jgi:nucleoside-diphosphate-sugar epimerase